jgi:hypothetical protein
MPNPLNDELLPLSSQFLAQLNQYKEVKINTLCAQSMNDLAFSLVLSKTQENMDETVALDLFGPFCASAL